MLVKRNVTTWDGRVVRCAFVRGINYPISDTGKRYITDYQIKNEYPEIWETFQNVINRKSKIMNEFVLDLFSKLDDDGILTWNQFNCLLPKKDKTEPQKRFKIDLNPNNRLKAKSKTTPETKQDKKQNINSSIKKVEKESRIYKGEFNNGMDRFLNKQPFKKFDSMIDQQEGFDDDAFPH